MCGNPHHRVNPVVIDVTHFAHEPCGLDRFPSFEREAQFAKSLSNKSAQRLKGVSQIQQRVTNSEHQ